MESASTMPAMDRPVVLASRESKLAQIQTMIVVHALENAFPSDKFTTSFMTTAGDKNQSQALYLLGGKSLWTKELEVALKEGIVDMLVHSLKDVPTVLPDGCSLGAILEREDPADSMVVKAGLKVNGKEVKTLDDLPEGSVIGTSSVRRVAQLKRKYPHLVFKDVVRLYIHSYSYISNHQFLFNITAVSVGSFPARKLVRSSCHSVCFHPELKNWVCHRTTRLSKLDAPDGPFAAIILAKAGLVRQDLGGRIASDIVAPTLFHAVGQGALGVEIRSNDTKMIAFCKALTHWQTQWKCLAERACLRVLEGGCSVPVGVHSELEVIKDEGEGSREARLVIVGSVTSIDGQQHVVEELKEVLKSVEDAEAVGSRLARQLLDSGAKQILDEITKDRETRIGEDKTTEEVHKIEERMEEQTGAAAA